MANILPEANAMLISDGNLIKGKLTITDTVLEFRLPDGRTRELFSYDIVASTMGKGQTKVKSLFLTKTVEYVRILSDAKSSGMYVIKDKDADALISSFNIFKINATDKRRLEEEAARQEQERKAEEERKRAEDEARKAEEERIRQEEAERKAEEKRKRTEEFLRQQEEARKEQEERLRIEEEARKAEEERLRAEEEARKAEEERIRQEEEARKAEEERKRQEEAEEERKRKLKEEQQRRAEEERIRREEEARRVEEECARIEAEARAAEEERLRKEEEERKHKEAEERAKREHVYKVLVEDPKTKGMMEMIANEPRVIQAKEDYLDGKITDQNLAYIMHDVHRNMLEEQKRIREEEARKKAEEEAARKAEEESLRKEEEERQRAEAERRAEEERLRKEEEERQRAEAERKAEEERLRKEEEERQRAEAERKAEEERLRKEEEKRQRAEAERKAEEERLRKEEEERQRAEAERKAEEERLKKEAEERERREEEQREYASSGEAGLVLLKRANYYLKEAGLPEIHPANPEDARSLMSQLPREISIKAANLNVIPEEYHNMSSDADLSKVDYEDEYKFEEDLNAGMHLDGKIVSFKVIDVRPNAALGFNLYAGKHLNFISNLGEIAKAGDRCVVKVELIKKLTFLPGSWAIAYSAIKVVDDIVIPENAIWVGGKPYANKAEIARTFGISPATLSNKLKRGWTYEQAVGLEEYVPPKAYYNGQEYASEQALAEAFGVKHTTYKSRIAMGWTQDEALGVMERIPVDPDLVNKVYDIENVCPIIKVIYDTNPYCVLGISALATRKDALTVSGKLEKYDKLRILHNYKTDYDLINIDSPNRELGHVQTVMMNLDKMQYRWLWFAESRYPGVWNRKVFQTTNNNNLSYEGLLACLFNCMISDPDYQDFDKWKKLLSFINSVCMKTDSELFSFIKSHVTDDDQRKYNYHMIVRSFKDSLVGAMLTNVSQQGMEKNSKFLVLVKNTGYCFEDEIVQKIAEETMSWANYEIGDITTVFNNIKAKKKPFYLMSDANEMVEPIDRFDEKSGFEQLELMAVAMEGIALYSDLLRDKIRKAIWDATDIINRGGNKKKAAKYDSKIFLYCNDEQKKQLKDLYKVENLDIPDEEITADECDAAADRYKEAEDQKKEFKWRMKAAQKGKASAMNSVGVAYALGQGVTANEKKAVEWYEKAAEHNEAYALCNLAIRYYNGSLIGGKEKAKEYWIRAYLSDRDCSGKKNLDEKFPGWNKEEIKELLRSFLVRWRRRIEPYANDGVLCAQFIMGKNYAEGTGFGFNQDDEKAKEWLKRAANAGYKPAKEFLKEKYGIDLDSKDYQHVEDTQIYRGFDTTIEFCGIERSGSNYGLKFWIYNRSNSDRQVWVKNCVVDRKAYGSITKIGEFEANSSDYVTYFIDDINFYHSSTISVEFELDDDLASEIVTLCRLKVNLNGITKAVTFTTEKLEIVPEPEIDYELKASDFTDKKIHNGLVNIEFCGANLDYSENCELKFWVTNPSSKDITIFAHNIKIDGKAYESFKTLGTIESYGHGYLSLILPDIDPEVYYDISLDIEVDQNSTEKLYDACRLWFRLPGDGDSNFNISYKDLEQPVTVTARSNTPATTSSYSSSSTSSQGTRAYTPSYTNGFDYATWDPVATPPSSVESVYTRISGSSTDKRHKTRYVYNENEIKIYLTRKPEGALVEFLKDNGWIGSSDNKKWRIEFDEDDLATAIMVINCLEHNEEVWDDNE